jgi:hypothetical protein
MSAIVFLLHLSLIAWIAYRVWKTEKHLGFIYWPALGVKLFGGIALGLVYTWYYKPGDTFLYYNDSMLVANLAKENFAQYLRFLWNTDESLMQTVGLASDRPRTLFMIKIVSLFNLVSYNNYWIVALYFSFFSFLGAWFLVQKISTYFNSLSTSAVVAFLFFPSMVFWSAGVIKESLTMGAMFFLSGIFLMIWFSDKIRIVNWLLVILCLWIVWRLKYYFAAVFFAVVIASLLYKFLLLRFYKPRTPIMEMLLWLIIFIVPLGAVMLMRPNFHPEYFFEVIRENYYAFSQISDPGDAMDFGEIKANAVSIVSKAPWALISGLFRPFIWEAGNLFQVVVALENLVLALVFIAGIPSWRFVFRSQHIILICGCIMYILLVCIFITLSTPNFGTLSRYRAGYLPYFIFLLFCAPPVLRILQRSFNRLVPFKS